MLIMSKAHLNKYGEEGCLQTILKTIKANNNKNRTVFTWYHLKDMYTREFFLNMEFPWLVLKERFD